MWSGPLRVLKSKCLLKQVKSSFWRVCCQHEKSHLCHNENRGTSAIISPLWLHNETGGKLAFKYGQKRYRSGKSIWETGVKCRGREKKYLMAGLVIGKRGTLKFSPSYCCKRFDF